MVKEIKSMSKKRAPKAIAAAKPKGVRKAPQKKKAAVSNVRKTKPTVAKSSPAPKIQRAKKAGRLQARSDRASSTPRTGFLSLSGELRNIIYNHVLIFDEKVLVGWGDNKKKRDYRRTARETRTSTHVWPPSGVPALLHVCRQIRQEGLSIFYSENTFALHEVEGRRPDPKSELRMILGLGWLYTRPTAWRFDRWCNSLGDNLKWLRKVHLCYRSKARALVCIKYQGDFFPYVKFAALHPDVSITVALEGDEGCGCRAYRMFNGQGIEDPPLAQLSDKIPILKNPAWVDEVRAGNMVALVGETEPMHLGYLPRTEPWDIKILEVTYRAPANEAKDEDDWHDLCDKLSLSYKFELKRKTSRGGTNFGMIVEAKEDPEETEETADI